MLSIIFLLFIAISVTSAAQGQESAPIDVKVQEMAQQIIKAHTAWKSKLSNSGASVRVEEIARQGKRVGFQLYVTGLPSDRSYNVLTWPVTQEKPSLLFEGVSLGKGGLVICAGRTPEQCGDPSKKDDPIDFEFDPAKGEPFRIALVSGEYLVATVIVPDPIRGKDKSCVLSVERLLPHFEISYFAGTGFPPNSELNFDAQSYAEKHTVKTKSDSDGNIQFAMLPAVSGHSRGTTTVQAVGMKCSPTLQFEWGQ